MADPVLVDCPEGQWTKVATNVTSGNIRKISYTPDVYLETYRLTGSAAPTLESEGRRLFEISGSAVISASAAIDVYIWPKEQDGKVRVDL